MRAMTAKIAMKMYPSGWIGTICRRTESKMDMGSLRLRFVRLFANTSPGVTHASREGFLTGHDRPPNGPHNARSDTQGQVLTMIAGKFDTTSFASTQRPI